MADFTPTTWNEGIAPGISAAQLNRMEAGIDQAYRPQWSSNTPVNVSNTIVKSMLAIYTIPGNTIPEGGEWRFQLSGSLLKDTTPGTITFEWVISTGIITSNALDVAQNGNPRSWWAELHGMRYDAGTDILNVRIMVSAPHSSGSLEIDQSNHYLGVCQLLADTNYIGGRNVSMTAQWSHASVDLSLWKRHAMLMVAAYS